MLHIFIDYVGNAKPFLYIGWSKARKDAYKSGRR